MGHTRNPSIQEAKAGRLQTQGQPDYMARLHLKKHFKNLEFRSSYSIKECKRKRRY
jgi:hypothetical protein